MLSSWFLENETFPMTNQLKGMAPIEFTLTVSLNLINIWLQTWNDKKKIND